MKLRFLFLFIGVLLISFNLQGQPKCYFEHYGSDNGLPQNTVMSIIQDRKGFIWLSTWDGLCKFDGNNFYSYKIESQSSTVSRSYRIDFIGEDKYGYIWTLPYDKEAQRFDPRTERFVGLSSHKEFEGKSTPTKEIYTAPSGKVWLRTVKDGCVCVLDSLFHIRVYNKGNKTLSSDIVNQIYEDHEFNTWILTDNGLYKTPKQGNTIIPAFVSSRTPGERNRFYCSLETDRQIWFGSSNGIVKIYDKKRNRYDTFDTHLSSSILFIRKLNNTQIVFASQESGFAIYNIPQKQLRVYNSGNLSGMRSNRIISCFIDRAENVWFELDVWGVSKFNPATAVMKHYEMKIENKSLSIIPPNFFIFEDLNNRLWVHPRGGGFSYYDPVTDNLLPFYNEPFSPSWRFSNLMHTAFSDKQGNLWLSTRSHGLEKAVFTNDIFKTSIVDPNIHSSVNNDIKAILEDRSKNLWISSKGGKIYVYQNGKQAGYLCKDGSVSIGDPVDGFCYCMMQDRAGNIWIGTKGNGIYKLKPISRLRYEITHYEHHASDVFSLSNDNIYSIFEDSKGVIWIGTYGGGLNIMDPKQDGRFYNSENVLRKYPQQIGNQIRIVTSDKYGNIYLGTTLGLIVCSSQFNNPANLRFSSYSSLKPQKTGFKGNDIYDICTTRQGETFIATFGGGVNKVIETDNQHFPSKFENYSKPEGLPSDIALSILEDRDGKLWIATEGYLTSFEPRRKSFETFSEVSRLIKGHNFSEGSRFSSPDGTIYFGFSNGYLSVKTDKMEENTFVPYLALTQLKIDNTPVPIGKKSPLTFALDDMPDLELNYKQNSFTISFAALDYVNPGNISYAYKLDGVDKDWVENTKQQQATYAKVASGKYVFHVRSTNSDGRWVNNERTITIIVHPPFWLSPLAFILYFILFCLLLYVALKTIFTFFRLEDKMKLEHEQIEMRTRFFTDISHEIRTPLTMIVAPIENMMEDSNTPSGIKGQLELVSKNANRMLRMVNQILDFRKIQKLQLSIQKTRIGRFVEDVCSNFQETADEKHITLTFENKVGEDVLWIDRDGVEKLLFNLVSNAMKFSSVKKTIHVEVFYKENNIAISVTDQGVGMTKEVLNKLFTRFASYNTDKSKPSTGIGLSIVKEVADKHKAHIIVNSELGRGSMFSVVFMKGTNHFDRKIVLAEDSDFTSSAPNRSSGIEEERTPLADSIENDFAENEEKQVILIVEDDNDLREFIKNSLSEHYSVLDASNGKEGYELAVNRYPDFILSDVMMPEMDGFELLQRIKENKNTSHIPFILLTAKTDIDSKLQGLTYGADDYITKPFSVKYLRVRMENIMKTRHELFLLFRDKDSFSMPATATSTEHAERTEEIQITPQDEEFVSKIKAFILDNIDNSNFVVEDLAREMLMSRTVFFKKLKALTGLAPVEFIREIKIRYAAEMILKEDYTIKEIAFMVGFADTKYFTQCFKQIFECTPSEYRKAHRE
ncbi:MAG: two-component regulator propeller domain-containing protein [Dysgonamonadaceae bacterium]